MEDENCIFGANNPSIEDTGSCRLMFIIPSQRLARAATLKGSPLQMHSLIRKPTYSVDNPIFSFCLLSTCTIKTRGSRVYHQIFKKFALILCLPGFKNNFFQPEKRQPPLSVLFTLLFSPFGFRLPGGPSKKLDCTSSLAVAGPAGWLSC